MKYVLISGANSGLAQIAIDEYCKANYVIFACDLCYKEIKVEKNIHYIPVDITNNESIKSAYEYVTSITDELDAVVNFAGIVILGSLVESNIDTLNKVLEVNTIGTYKMNNMFFPLIYKAKGRFINISSEYAKISALPIHSFYPISKHAIDVYIDSLRREMLPLGVKVVGIRPGAFKTQMQGGVEAQFDYLVNNTTLHKKGLLRFKSLMTNELKKAKSTEKFRKTFKKAAFKAKPKRYYNVANSFKMKLLTILPEGLKDFIFKKFFQ